MNCEMVLQGLSSNLNWSILQHQCEDAVAQLRAAKTRSTSSYHLEIFALLSLLHHLLFSLNHTATMVEQKHGTALRVPPCRRPLFPSPFGALPCQRSFCLHGVHALLTYSCGASVTRQVNCHTNKKQLQYLHEALYQSIDVKAKAVAANACNLPTKRNSWQ